MQILIGDRAKQILEKLPIDVAKNITSAIALLNTPLSVQNGNRKRLPGGDFYLKVGNYRIIYRETQNIEISNIETKDRLAEETNGLVLPYLTLRNLIGICGMLLPSILFLCTSKLSHGKLFEPSISDYYYTNTGDVLVVILCLLGAFLLTYKGYSISERLLTTLAAVCGIGVAFSPTAIKEELSPLSVHSQHTMVAKWFGIERHLWFAATFFLALSLMSLIFFPKSEVENLASQKGKKSQKSRRNLIYRTCGIIMILCVIVLGIYFITLDLWGHQAVAAITGDWPIVFICETIAIEAFGISWLTKGETIFPDGENYLKQLMKR